MVNCIFISELTSGEESDWSTTDESSSEKTPATLAAAAAAAKTKSQGPPGSPPEGTTEKTPKPLNEEDDGFKVAKYDFYS